MVDFYGLDKFLTSQAGPVDDLLNALRGVPTGDPMNQPSGLAAKIPPALDVQPQPNLIDLTLQDPAVRQELESIANAVRVNNPEMMPVREPSVPRGAVQVPTTLKTPSTEKAPVQEVPVDSTVAKAEALRGKFPGLKVDVDAKGQLTLSGRGNLYAPATPDQEMLAGSVQGRAAAVLAAPDYQTKIAAFGELEQSAAEERARITGDSIKQAELKVGLPGLEQQLRASELRDRASPNWERFRVDSPGTASIRRQVEDLRGKARVEAEAALKSNIALAGMEAQVSAVKRNVLLSEKSAERLGIKEAQLDMQSAQRREEAYIKVGDTAIRRAQAIDTNLRNKDPKDVAMHVAYGLKDKDQQAALLTPSEDLPKLAYVESNPFADKVLVAEEAAKSGQNEAAVAERWNNIKTLANDDKRMKAFVKTRSKEEQEAFNVMANQSLLKGKEGQAAYKQAKLNMALSMDASLRTAQFANDVSKWPILEASPKLKDAVNKARELSGKADITSVFTAYIGDPSVPGVSTRRDEFYQLMRNAGDTKSKSMLDSVDTNTLIINLGKQTIETRLKGLRDLLQSTATLGTPGAMLGLTAKVGEVPGKGIADLWNNYVANKQAGEY
jgi:hypothetical protein